MRKRNLVFLFIILFIIAICLYIYLNNKMIPQIVSDFEDFLYKYEDFDEELPVHFSDECSEYEKEVVYITKHQAIEDIENLFSLLKFGYSAYSYFGGDEVFYLAKEKILKLLNVIESRNISKTLLSDIIKFNLDFIQDSHFSVNGDKLCDYTKYFSTRKYKFYKDFKGFYTYIDDTLYYLTKVNNSDV